MEEVISLNIRIKKLRKFLDLTQQEFADRIGIKRNTLANYEVGRNEPIDAVVNLICREFNVNETWLRTGEGEMFKKKEPGSLDALLSDLLGGEKVTTEDQLLIKNFLELSNDSRKAVIEFVQKCAKELSSPLPSPTSDVDLAARLAELERQNKEIMAQNQALAAEIAAIREEDAAIEAEECMEQSVIRSQFR